MTVLSTAAACAGDAAAPVPATVGGSDAGPSDAGASTTGPRLLVGDPCSQDIECPAGGSGTATCITGAAYPGGYCAVEACATHGHDCPGNGVESQCVVGPTDRCLKLCASDPDCRDGYVCRPEPDSANHGTVSVCVPT